jgi:NAD(P)-dependent dehydrogenase (short-subunit alcohol dehydrogenase family)
MPTVLITGASRGLGLEFARQYCQDGWKVIATARNINNAVKLNSINNMFEIREMDVTNHNHIQRVKCEFLKEKIDVLINNAGIHGAHDERSSFGDIDIKEWLSVFMTNTIAPLKVTEAFFDNVKKSIQKKIVFISSRSGSITERGTLPHHKPGGPYIYRSSKAALNAITQNLSYDLTRQGFCVIVLHPGFVKTEMAIGDTELDVSTSIAGMKKIIAESTPNDNGLFRTFEGEKIFW